MKAIFLVFAVFLVFLPAFAQSGEDDQEEVIELLKVGDSVVMTIDTTLVAAFVPEERGMATYALGDSMLFTHNGVTYKLSEIMVTHLAFPGNDAMGPRISVRAYQVDGNHFFTAHVSGSVKPANGKVIINPCKFTYVSAGRRTDACDIISNKEGCEPKSFSIGSMPCELSASYNKKSLAYAVEQHFLKQYRNRGGW